MHAARRIFPWLLCGLVGCQTARTDHTCAIVVEPTTAPAVAPAEKLNSNIQLASHNQEEVLIATKLETSRESIEYCNKGEGESADASQESASLELVPTPNTLTLASLEEIAFANSPAMKQAEAKIEVARGNWIQGGLAPSPRLGYAANEMGNDNSTGQQGGYIAQEFIRGGKLGLNQEIAAWNLRQAEEQLAAETLRVQTDVRIAFYQVLIAQRRKTLALKLLDIGQKGLAAAESRFKIEQVSKADPLRAKVELETTSLLVQNTEAQQKEAWRKLQAAAAMPDLKPQTLQGDLDPKSVQLTWDKALERIQAESPLLAKALAREQAAKWKIERACAEVTPNVDTQVTVQKDTASGNTFASVQIEIPLNLFNRNQGGIYAAESEAIAAERASERVLLELQSKLSTVFRRYKTAKNQIHIYTKKDGILSNADQTLKLIRAGYQAEEFSVIDLLSAQKTFFQANLDYLVALEQLWVSASEIEGLLLKDSLTQ